MKLIVDFSVVVQAPNEPMDPSQNLSLLQYVNSKLPQAQTHRETLINPPTSQTLQKYFASQQYQLKPKYEVRTARNVHIFDETQGSVSLVEIRNVILP